MGKIKERIKMFVDETDAVYMFREKIKVKALKIAKALIQAMQKLISLIKIFPKINPW